MNRDEKIKEVMATVFEVEPADINDSSSPDTIAKWDSLHHMNLIVALEEEFNVSFKEEDISNMLNYQLIKLTLADHGALQ
jgi:acyl carrier protein